MLAIRLLHPLIKWVLLRGAYYPESAEADKWLGGKNNEKLTV